MKAILNHATNLLSFKGSRYPIELDRVSCQRDTTVYKLLKKLGYYKVSQKFSDTTGCTTYNVSLIGN